MLLILSLIACLVTPQSPGGDDTNKHSGGAQADTAEAAP